MSTSVTIKQGDSLSLSYSISPRQDMSAWTCRVQVREDYRSPVLQEIFLTQESADTYSKIGVLQTNSIQPGHYYIFAQLDNSSTSESKEVENLLIIEEQGVY